MNNKKYHPIVLVLLVLMMAITACTIPSTPFGDGTPEAETPVDSPPPSIPNAQSDVDCPTDGEMQEAHGFTDIKPVNTGLDVPWEGCKWTLQAVGQHVFEDVPFLMDYQYTYTDADGVPHVAYGDGKNHDIMGATFRYLPWYKANNEWVTYPNSIFAGETRYGLSMDPSYLHENYNLELGPCPSSTQEVASWIGGTASDWTAPDWEGGAWVYDGPTISFTVPLGHPSWVDLDGAPLWQTQSGTADNFSYHCHR